MAIIPVTSNAELTSALLIAVDGDTLVLTGTFPARTFTSKKYLSSNLIFDLTAAVITAEWRLNYCEGMTFNYGAFTGLGTSLATNALTLVGCKEIKVFGGVFTGNRVCISANGLDGCEVLSTTMSGMINDGMVFGNARSVRVEDNDLTAPNILNPAHHPDAIQFFSITGQTPCADLEVINNRISGAMQGVFLGDHGTGGYDRVTIQFNTVVGGFGNGIGVTACRVLTLQENDVSTLPGSTNQCRINLGSCTSITRCGNTVAAYTTPAGGNKPAVNDAACAPPITPPTPPSPPAPPAPPGPPPPPPPSVSALQSEIAQLTTDLSLANGNISRLQSLIASVAQTLATA